MPTPLPHQLEGAAFLSARKAALLADEPRVGKTGAAIMACDDVYARKVLVVTKASARADWGRQFREWQIFPRKVQVIYSTRDALDPTADVVVVGWGMIFHPGLLSWLKWFYWDAVILDESHEAKSPEAKRTKAVYTGVLSTNPTRVWCLSGTPIPNAPNDLWSMLNALAPDRLDGLDYKAFMHRYCVVKKKYVGGQWIEYAIKGKNEDELRERLKGFWLRRTQQDVGIREPLFSYFELHADKLDPELVALEKDPRSKAILEAAETGARLTGDDEIHLGTLRRLTGQVIARAAVEAAAEALDEGLDRIVLMYWHKEVGNIIREGLSSYGVVGIDGSTPPTARQAQVDAFRAGTARVFAGQILAAGEAIDLSASAEMWFVEMSPVPKDMKQAALRCTNHSQMRQVLVRICVLAGSITGALTDILTRKVGSITKIMETN